MEDRVPSSDIHIERRPEGGAKDKAKDHSSEQDQGLPPRRSRLDNEVRHGRIISRPGISPAARREPRGGGSKRTPLHAESEQVKGPRQEGRHAPRTPATE
jgi:hypothetical protein